MVLYWKPEPSLPKRTARVLRIAGEWTLACPDMSQIEDLLSMIKKHKDEGVTGASVMYSWVGRRIQPLQKHGRFGFEYFVISEIHLGFLQSALRKMKPCCE
jgi:hypothetical protein